MYTIYEYSYSSRFPTVHNLLCILGHGVVCTEYGERCHNPEVTLSKRLQVWQVSDSKSGRPRLGELRVVTYLPSCPVKVEYIYICTVHYRIYTVLYYYRK